MNKCRILATVLLMALVPFSGLVVGNAAAAGTQIVNESFTGASTTVNKWIYGGSGGDGACLTAAASSSANSIPACSTVPPDMPGDGGLRLTRPLANESGFAIYNTPIPANDGLDVSFDMAQYGGTGADGIVFFLIDGSKSPTQPGSLGGSLGYSDNIHVSNPGLVGGYVGVGFDRFGNFSHPDFGSGGTGKMPNSITLRGSEATGYRFITQKTASGPLGDEAANSRGGALRHVRITISTNNIMSVGVDYGSGMVTEPTGINLSTINGAGSLPSSFKFGFSAGTGGQNNYHEISGLTVAPMRPDVTNVLGTQGGLKQSETGVLTLASVNDASAEPTGGNIVVTETVPTGLKLLTASGDGWSCQLTGQKAVCTRPGSGQSALAPGGQTPLIKLGVRADDYAPASLSRSALVQTFQNVNGDQTKTGTVAISPAGDLDGIADSIETAAPNGGDANGDGTADSTQIAVTSYRNQVSGAYATLETTGCASNRAVGSVAKYANQAADNDFSYPLGLMNFTLTCAAPGNSATVTHYYFGDYDAAKFVLRKYNPTSHSYATVQDAVLSNVRINGTAALKVVYSLTDGGPLDDDGVADGYITDPAGPALKAAAVVAPATGLASAGLMLPAIALVAGAAIVIWQLARVRR